MSQTSKPNPLAPNAEKESDKYGLAFGKYIEGKAIGTDFSYYRQRRDRIRQARAYAQGDQDNSIYKQAFNANGDNSWANLNYTPLGIGSKFTSALVSDLLDEFNFNVKAIDAMSMSKRNNEKFKVLGNFYNRDIIENIKKVSGIDIAEDEFVPDSLEEVELHMSISYKQSVEIAMKQIIMYVLHNNDYPDEIRQNILYDLIVGGIGVADVRFEPSNGIRVSHVDVENFVFSESAKVNMQDPQWAGEIKWMTIGDVRRLSNGKFEEKQLEQIYEKFKGRYHSDGFYNEFNRGYNNTNDGLWDNFYYDSMTVPVLRFAFKAEDYEKQKVTKSKYGERRYLKKGDYEPKGNSKNVAVDTSSYEVVYEGYYILGTEHVFNYGRMKNMIRPNGSLTKVELPYKVYAPKFANMTNKSIIEMIIPYIDGINLAHLKMQQVIAKTHPETTVIDIEGWMNVSLGSKDFDPLELQDIYDATGVVYTKSRGEQGEPIKDPVRSFANQVNIGPYIDTINYYVQLIRETMGFTPEREGITKNKQLVGVTELSIAASRNSTQYIKHALDNITKRVCKDVAWRVQDTPKTSRFWKVYEEAVGAADMAVIGSMEEIPLAELGIFINALPSNEERVGLEQDIERSLAQQEIRIEDAMMVRKLSRSAGIDTAYQYMAVKRKKYFQEKMMMSQQEKDMETQRQLQMQQLSAQAKQQEQEMQMQIEQLKIQGASQSKIAELREEYRLRSLLSEQEFEQDYQLEMVSDQGQMGKEKYKEDRKDQRAEQQAKLTAKQKVQVDKVKSGAQTEVNEDEIKGKDELQELIS
jgi:hypothetical protein